MPIDVRMLAPHEAALLDHVAPGVFDNPIDAALRSRFFATPGHMLAVALDGDLVVGMASGVEYLHPDKPLALWVNEVGVAPTYQRQGIGRRLMETLPAHARTRGCCEAWLGTEPDNIAAQRLYAAAGGTATPMIMFEFDLGDRA